MSQKPAAPVSCSNHPGIPATVTCDHCGRAVCDQCCVSLIARELDFCSDTCLQRYTAQNRTEYGSPDRPPISNQQLIENLRHPFVNGARLFSRSFLPLIQKVALPLSALIVALLASMGGLSARQYSYEATGFKGTLLSLVCLACWAFVIFAMNMLTSRIYTGGSTRNLYSQVARSFFRTLGAWIIFLLGVLIGAVMLIIPGIIAGVRLFWADEYALLHGMGPIRAARASADLTRGYAWPTLKHQLLTNLMGELLLVAAIIGLNFSIHPIMTVFPEYTQMAIIISVLVLALTLTYAFVHASEVVYFYGLRALKYENERKNERTPESEPR
ncbi:MAG: hypothetical protein RBT76_01720 [candidate division Zixibacteria bacterium]|jgi:hypothetical protein|nr:hypothetical protein [candidate division Zixibacteria bacterium]